jgi:hypothetical protein
MQRVATPQAKEAIVTGLFVVLCPECEEDLIFETDDGEPSVGEPDLPRSVDIRRDERSDGGAARPGIARCPRCRAQYRPLVGYLLRIDAAVPVARVEAG